MLRRKLFHLTNGTLVDLYVGDITTVPLDAVVNIGNSTLSNRNGLNKVILDRAGNDIVQEINRKINATQKKRLDFGEVLLTGGGRLASKKIIHTVAVTFKNAHVTDVAAVRKVMQTCLKKAKAEKFISLAFPAIGTGKSYFKHDECIDAYVSELKSWRSLFPKEIHFVVYSGRLFNEIQATFSLHFSSPSNVTGNSSFYVNNSLSSNRKRKNSTSKNSASSGSLFQNDNVQKNTLQNNSSGLGATGGAATAFVDTVSSDPTVPNDTCTICLCDFTDRKTLKKCGHSFCSACINQSFSSVGPSCPICQTVYGKVIGLQPPGTMTVQRESKSLPGFPGCKHFVVFYQIPSGIQTSSHPNPGASFSGVTRTAYLPCSKEGETIVKMLQRAFEQKLIFTVGDSRTTNMSDVVTWNDIHHKTSIMGGLSRYGYPDPNYLQRVSEELKVKGITPEDVRGEKIKPRISV